MELLTQDLKIRLVNNGRFNATRRAAGKPEIDFMPLVKLFCPWGGGTWLLSEIDPEDADLAFGLCDLGLGFPELGSVSLSELEEVRGPGGLRIERDLYFTPDKTLGSYAEEARIHERIVS
ncbi:hypothetical protein A33M_2930 [Rhodovulum sp. PH10]|uniref:DUF2958 domain-containing protein n=1 Tax=Rhodovulum sp. PH10 TaxID=1187851 RepID=UPI00027C2B5A|nr:DUF2958 domain-containing protein [Rhodovulum sp. PH10]EJW11627.1 hypothetical protein A33M_2930 [Rhodovulum sp. PH10]